MDITLLILLLIATDMKRYFTLMILSLCMNSCNYSGIVTGIRVEQKSPESFISLECDSVYSSKFPELKNVYALQIVNDSILVFQERATESNPYHFKAYSINTFEYIGPFVHKGRGPGEMLAPHIAKSSMCKDYLTLNDNSVGCGYFVDVDKSLISHNIEILRSFEFQTGVIDWLPLSEGKQFVLQSVDNAFVFHSIDTEGECIGTFNLYEWMTVDRHTTHLSGFLLDKGDAEGLVAEVMMFFPQVNIIDISNGDVRSFAVDKAWRNWRTVINSRLDMNTIQYYVGAVSTGDYIIAAYKGCSLGELNDADRGTKIHVFDWHGNFLKEITVEENISDMAYDYVNRCIYCIEQSQNKIIRYNLDDVLSIN